MRVDFDDIRGFESRLDDVEVFELLEYLKRLAVLEADDTAMREAEILIEGLIERIQERIVLQWYK